MIVPRRVRREVPVTPTGDCRQCGGPARGLQIDVAWRCCSAECLEAYQVRESLLGRVPCKECYGDGVDWKFQEDIETGPGKVVRVDAPCLLCNGRGHHTHEMFED